LKFAEKLSNPILGEYRFRIGDYRVIFDIEGNEIINTTPFIKSVAY
jgi:mRNA-degrading endonuclease RelE of RelBE toxin-antitoxin system